MPKRKITFCKSFAVLVDAYMEIDPNYSNTKYKTQKEIKERFLEDMEELEWSENTLARLFANRKIHSLCDLTMQPIRYGYIEYDNGSRDEYAMYLFIDEDGGFHVDKVVKETGIPDWADVT